VLQSGSGRILQLAHVFVQLEESLHLDFGGAVALADISSVQNIYAYVHSLGLVFKLQMFNI